MAKQTFTVPWLPYAETLVEPRTVEEDQIIEDLDVQAFRELTLSWDKLSLNRDPAYLAWAVRRHHFWQWYGEGEVFPESRPAKGSPVKRWYDEKRPWYVPGLELFKRIWYPEGWDDYVNKGIKPVRRSIPFANVADSVGREGSAAPQPAVPVAATASARLMDARQKLKAAEEAKEIREVEAKLRALEREEQEAKQTQLALQLKRQEFKRKRQEVAAIEAEKAEIQAAARKSGQHGFRKASTNRPSTNEGFGSPKWNREGKRSKTATSAPDEISPSERKPVSQALTTPGVRTAPSTTGETQAQRQRRVFGWDSGTEKKPVGSRQAMGRGPTEYIVATLRRKWYTHFQGHKEVVLKIKHETQCELMSQYDGVGPLFEITISGKDGKPYSNVLKAHEMMLMYCEDILKQEDKIKKGLEKEKGTCMADMLCHACGKPGHLKANCSITLECWNCKKTGHMSKQCPKPPAIGPRCRNCDRKGHLARDCKEPKSQDPRTDESRSKGDRSKAPGSQNPQPHTPENQEAENLESRGVKWTQDYLQSKAK
jgi:hypothetical protein